MTTKERISLILVFPTERDDACPATHSDCQNLSEVSYGSHKIKKSWATRDLFISKAVKVFLFPYHT